MGESKRKKEIMWKRERERERTAIRKRDNVI